MRLAIRTSGALSLLAGLGIWLLPRFVVVPPELMRSLLAVAGLGGLLAFGLAGTGGNSGGARTAGGLALVSALLALVVLFTLPAGAIPVQRANASLPPSEPPTHLQVLVFNAHHGYPDLSDLELRVAALTTALVEIDPDLVLLQEAWCMTGHGCLAERLAEELGHAFVYSRANGSRHVLGFEEGSAILSRWPIRAAERWVLSPRVRPWRARIAVMARVASSGSDLPVGTFHLENLDPMVADGQAASLARRLPEGGALLLGGDLNRDSGTPAARSLTSLGLSDALPGTIDHLFYGPGWEVHAARWALGPEEIARIAGHPVEISDHRALLVELELAR